MLIIDVSKLLGIIGGLVILVNILVQVIKQITWDKIPTNILAVIISQLVTLGGGAWYAQMNHIAIVWYLVVAAVVVGFLVAYAAMFGYDKLMQALGRQAASGGGTQ